MDPKTIDQNPKISDTILFELETTNTGGTKINPYKVDRVVIYFLSRDFIDGNTIRYDKEIDDQTFATYFAKAETIKVYGNENFPAWLSTDLDNAVITKVGTGEFELLWIPEFAREGDYIICWTWTPLVADTPISTYLPFVLKSDTQATTSIPTHFTQEDKYPTLLERYTPNFAKLKLYDEDLTPETINNFNLSVADGFTLLEDLANQMPDLLDANVVHEQLILFLANTLGVPLRSNDVTLWRRQIKRAVPLFKKKGTLGGLTEALQQAGISFTGLTKLWQVVSSSTWQESFKVVDDNVTFTLSRLAIITPSIDTDNFELYLRPVGDEDYVQLSMDYVTFSNLDGVTTMSWVGDLLSVSPIVLEDGDFVKIIYKIAEPDDQNLEDYIRTLPLADLRDEVDVTYPPKNWNVRLIEEDDAMFAVICPTRHPFADPIVWGKIRTEFPYSENIYNMEEYNGSTRDSTDPCHLDKNFLDSCSCCASSKFNINIEIENISDNRIDEAEDIIRDFIPFHAQIQTINYKGKISDYVLPPVETVQCLINMTGEENLVMGQGDFRRSTTTDIKRDMLANATVVDSSTGTGENIEIVLYSPDINFSLHAMGIIPTNNLLEILSGPNIGTYTVESRNNQFVKINQGSPSSIAEPASSSAFTYRLSNQLFSGSVTSVTQSDLYTFSDSAVDLRHTNVQPGWKITVTSPVPQAGTYVISKSYPDDTLVLASWPTTTNVDPITYQLKTNLDVNVGDPSTTGAVQVTRRGLVNAGTTIEPDFALLQGDYLLLAGSQYQIVEFPTTSTFYITNYTAGNMGVSSVKVYRRLTDNQIGYLKYNGMTLTTGTNYETSLGIMNGANGSGIVLENSSAKENYLVLIGSTYYGISEIDGTLITLSGPKLTWQLSGTSVGFSIVHVENQNVVVEGEEFYLIDRRTSDVVKYEITTGGSMMVMAAAINKYNQGQPFSPVHQAEQISCTIEYRSDDA